MAEFHEAREAYSIARGAADSKRTEVVRAREEARLLRRQAETLARRTKAGAGTATEAELAELERRATDAEARHRRLRGELAQVDEAKLAALGEFAVFTDPTDAVERLPDDTPIALFPLRLETRFKTIDQAGTSHTFLWVRVFPDDALVDSFQPEISQAELTNVTVYWTHRWRAGGDEARRRAAWAALVKSHGAGRAKWLTDQVVPVNLGDEPVLADGERLLVVRPPAPLPANERAAIGEFWQDVWSSGGADRNSAYATLEGALGPARAAEVEAELEPVNLRDTAVRPDSGLTPRVVFLDLPDPAGLPLSAEDWTRGARAWLMPERLVLLGFRDGGEVLREVGAPIPSELQIGVDPSAADSEQIDAGGEDLQVPEGMRWTVDFQEAVAKGMGFAVDLTALGVEPRFDRLFVLGVRVGSDAEEGAAELAELVTHHQASRKGFSLLPQGRATNNTDASNAGWSWWEDPDESWEHFFATDPADDPTEWNRRKDGAWLAGLLGLDPQVLRGSPDYYGTDQAEARAMNVALYPATLGYWMEQMMEPVFSEETVNATRDFFNRFVLGRGTLPAVRVGRQPYGILPATVWSRLSFFDDTAFRRSAQLMGLPSPKFLSDVYDLASRLVETWRLLAPRVSHVGRSDPDSQQTLLDIVGLHPTSAELYQRYSQTFTQHYNALGFETELVSSLAWPEIRAWAQRGFDALMDLGWNPPMDSELPELLKKVFLKEAHLLKGDVVAPELSETEALAPARADGLNYMEWLQSAARTSHEVLRKQEGFADGVPRALLYLMLHRSLDEGFIDTSLLLRRAAHAWTDEQLRLERREPQFLHIAEQGDGKSRWESLYRPDAAVTGDGAQRLGDFIPTILDARRPYLYTQLRALDVLKGATTASLERAFIEHVDCLSYRLDAWRLGLQSVQLSYMRRESEAGFGRGGVYVGAYGWLEDVQPKGSRRLPAELDAQQEAIFDAAGGEPLMRDNTNFGHIHAPSLDHAVTAGILRNGHRANATPGAPDLLAVDLSSERVRLAQQVIEGIRNGQSLGALLGYRLERALHDEPDLFLDRLIYDLRRHFPLVGNRNRLTRAAVSSITKVEARNVVDGLAFSEHIVETGSSTYPYGLGDLPPLSDFTGSGLPSASQIGELIDGHVEHMRSIGDAVGDLAVAEGVYQVVRGNYDRAAGALDAFSKGTHAPETEVTATPRSGRTLTHRLGLHLQGGLLPADPANTTPRAKGEPALARWLDGQVPEPTTIFARVSWSDPAGVTDGSATPSMAQLGLGAVDLFYLLDAGSARDMPGFDDLLIDFAGRTGAPPPRADAVFSLEYRPDSVPGLALFEVAPLVRALRGVVLGARPLRPTDLALQNEASAGEDAAPIVRTDKPSAVLTDLQMARPPLDAFVGAVETAVGEAVDPVVARDAARDQIDGWIDDFAALLRPVAPFGLQAGSLTRAVEGRRAPFAALLDLLSARLGRWQKKEDEFTTVMGEYAALPGTATDAERTALLLRAARTISTQVITPVPPPQPPAAPNLEDEVAALHTAFATARSDLQTLHDSATTLGAALQAVTAFAPTLADVDQQPFDLEPVRDSVLALARELGRQAALVRNDVDRRIAKATDALGRAAAAVGDRAQAAASEAARAMLGESFVLLPELVLSQERLDEWDNVWTGRADLVAHLKVGPEATPYPVEDWLHNVARVRERPRQLEAVTLLGPALGALHEPTLEVLQFPHRPDNAWLGLGFPDTLPSGDPFTLEEDKLLYSASFASGAQIDATQPAKTYCGLMLDEWVEVIPTERETTGLAFHYDRPGTEAPQAILLVTPPSVRGAWHWQDLVDSLDETLDFARLRAVEPAQLDTTKLGVLVPAILAAVTVLPITAMLNFAFNNNIQASLAEGDAS